MTYYWAVEWRSPTYAKDDWVTCTCECEGDTPSPYYSSQPRKNIGFTIRDDARRYARNRRAEDKNNPNDDAIYRVRKVVIE